jgi:hypothetical protein
MDSATKGKLERAKHRQRSTLGKQAPGDLVPFFQGNCVMTPNARGNSTQGTRPYFLR